MTDKEKNYVKIGVGVLGAIVLFKLVVPKTDNSGSAQDPTGNGSTPVGTPGGTFNANATADKLYNAMKDLGTDEDKILNALMYVTPTQFAQVVKAFGKQSYNKTLGNQIRVIPWQPLTLYPLQVWLENELSSEQYNILALKYAPLL
ncbi:hypothetical protein AMR72_16315 [Flavobacterium psychrophilum]|nr:hypothetical protein AMR72_16315 [Flavobacterium psychrophilum]AOE53929.1 hypothetical protein ALW18_16305 [Flavobacterium psychrophilum]